VNTRRRNMICVVILAFGLVLAVQTFARQARREAPPEQKDLVAAMRIEDLNARIKELERIKAAFPNSSLMSNIDGMILTARIGLCATVDAVADLQRPVIAQAQGFRKVALYYTSSMQIISHKSLKQFDKKRVTETISGYADAGRKAIADPEILKSIPPQQQNRVSTYIAEFYLVEAQAFLNEGSAAKALKALETFKKGGGETGPAFHYTFATANAQLGKNKEALEGYFEAAVENYQDAVDKAREYYQKVNGKPDGFEAKLEAKWRELPYHPGTFQPAAEWKGKAVLAEMFTGSECPPCVGADLGFDGLIEAYAPKYLAILVYHLPIPRPDPIMNPATKKRQDYYAVNSTPTTIIDGNKKVGGGSKAMAEGKFKEYRDEINAKINEAPQVVLKAAGTRAGDIVKIDYSFDKVIPNAEYNIALVQKEEKYRGSNGIVFHKLVVRDFATVDPAAAAKQVSFDLAANEKATDLYLTEFEKTYDRIPNFRFAERHLKIDRTNLAFVFFAQDKETKKVLNAFAADVK
jgi:thiol-disulfide isomerase/thioredoxin